MPSCAQCSKAFQTPLALKQHLKDSAVPHPYCHVCDRAFTGQVAHSAHMADKHKEHMCLKCKGKTFSSKGALNAHYRDSPHHPHCQGCGIGFANDAASEQHARVEHSPSVATPPTFTCSQCHAEPFLSQEDLAEHYRVSPLHPNCNQCSIGFENESLHVQHMQIAHPQKNCSTCDTLLDPDEPEEDHYFESSLHPSCSLCGLGFRDYVQYDRHMASAHPEMRCKLCQCQFYTSGALHKHYRSSSKHRQCLGCDCGSKEGSPLAIGAKRAMSPRAMESRAWTPLNSFIYPALPSPGLRKQSHDDQLNRCSPYRFPLRDLNRSSPLQVESPVDQPQNTLNDDIHDDDHVSQSEHRSADTSFSSSGTSETQIVLADLGTTEQLRKSSEDSLYSLVNVDPVEEQAISPTSPPEDSPQSFSDQKATSGVNSLDFLTPEFDIGASSEPITPETEKSPNDMAQAAQSRLSLIINHAQLPPAQTNPSPERLVAQEAQPHNLFSTSGIFDLSPPSSSLASWNWELQFLAQSAGLSLPDESTPSPEEDKHLTRCSSPIRHSSNESSLSIISTSSAVSSDHSSPYVSLSPNVSPPSALESLPLIPMGTSDSDGSTREMVMSQPSTMFLHVPQNPQISQSPAGSDIDGLPLFSTALSSPRSFENSPAVGGPSFSFGENLLAELLPYTPLDAGIPPARQSLYMDWPVIPWPGSDSKGNSDLKQDPIADVANEHDADVEESTVPPSREIAFVKEALPAEEKPYELIRTPEPGPSSTGTPAESFGASPKFHCRVCLKETCDDLTATFCGHIFCNSCITEAVMETSRCPVCKAPTLLYCLFRIDLSA